MKWIELTNRAHNEPVLLNVETINSVRGGEFRVDADNHLEKCTRVICNGCEYYVRETYEQIKKMILGDNKKGNLKK